MSLEATIARISLLTGGGAPPPVAAPPSTTARAGSLPGAAPATTGANPAFASQLQSLLGGAPTAATWGAPPPGGAGARALSLAQGEVGVAEAPPGSNDGPRIGEYRAAVPGGPVGPWCAYFVSWAARGAGTPLGEQGQGFAAVSDVWAWAQRSGRAIPPTGRPQPGDLIVWGGRHIGMVESVGADGSVHTVEGNSSDAVSRRTYGPDGGGATGYVRLG